MVRDGGYTDLESRLGTAHSIAPDRVRTESRCRATPLHYPVLFVVEQSIDSAEEPSR